MRSTLAIAAIALFTVWITWRAKALEMGASRSHAAKLRFTSPLLLSRFPPSTAIPSPSPTSAAATSSSRSGQAGADRAAWNCPLCSTFYARTHKNDAAFEIIAVSIDTSREDAAQAAAELKIPFLVLHDPGQKTADKYGIDGIPTLFVIDKNGVSYSNIGFDMSMEIMLAQQLGVKNYNPANPEGSGQ